MTIVNDNSRVINKLEASLTDDARVVIYDCQMFIVQATDAREVQALYSTQSLAKELVLYSQKNIFFITYEWAQKAKVLHYTRLGRLNGDKYSSLLGPGASNREN